MPAGMLSLLLLGAQTAAEGKAHSKLQLSTATPMSIFEMCRFQSSQEKHARMQARQQQKVPFLACRLFLRKNET